MTDRSRRADTEQYWASAATAANAREADNPLATDARSTAEIIATYLNCQRKDDAAGSLATVHYRGGSEEFRAGLELLASPDPRERAAGADVLAQLGWQDRTFLEESVDALLNALRDPDGQSCSPRSLPWDTEQARAPLMPSWYSSNTSPSISDTPWCTV